MYEVYFGLSRRPFFATPDTGCWFPGQPAESALAEIERCVTSGQGIAVLTAPAGLGKTLICRQLVARLTDQFRPAFLTTGNFTTRRSLLQAILHELAQPYSGMGEQELRIELSSTIQALASSSGGLLLIIDEAHLLGDRLLEELRLLADLSHNSTAPVRVVLSGQPQLEEQLTNPGLEAFNQRIGAHVLLDTLNRQESIGYILHRMQWAGGDDRAIFQADALELIARAADGVPRCLNQLCDHSLLLGYVGEKTEIDVATVREALGDLQHLPLHWNPSVISELCTSMPLDGGNISNLVDLPPQSAESDTAVELADFADDLAEFREAESSEEAAELEGFAAENDIESGLALSEQEEPAPGASFEVGADMDFHLKFEAELPYQDAESPASSIDDWIDHELELAAEAFADETGEMLDKSAESLELTDSDVAWEPESIPSTPPVEYAQPETLQSLPFQSIRQESQSEEVVVDRYAALDAGRDPEEVKALVGSEQPAPVLPVAHEPPRRTATQTNIPTFDDISHLRPDVLIERILPLVDDSQYWSSTAQHGHPGHDHPTFAFDSLPQLAASHELPASPAVDQEELLGELVLDMCLEAQEAIEDRSDEPPPPRIRHTVDGAPRVTRFDVVQPESSYPESGYFDIPPREESAQPPAEPAASKPSAVPRPNYKLLFSKLRRRQQQERR